MRIDHVAHPCYNPHETHQFYAGVLGLTLMQAYAGKDLLLIYALPDGGSLAFTASPHNPRQSDSAADWERRHVGLTVDSKSEFDRWLSRLDESGVRYKIVEGERIYFSDPDGLVLELEVASPTTINAAAHDVLARWRPE